MMPRIETTVVHNHPHGGEVACVPPMAVIANAIYNATGVNQKTAAEPGECLLALKEAGGSIGASTVER